MEFKPLSGRDFPRFSGLKTFFRLPFVETSADYDVALFGTPFDGGVSYRPGARFAPTKIRELSSLGRGFHWGRGVSLFEKIKVADIGDCPTVPIDIAQTYEKIESFAGKVLSLNKRFLSVGGDHSTTLPFLRAVHRHYKVPLQLIHFDAHLDTYPPAWGQEYHHGAFLRHVVTEGLADPKKTIQFGLRGPLAGEPDLDFVRKHQIQSTTIDDLRETPFKDFMSRLKIDPKHPTYITFDIDCLDPAYAPGTGTPVIGGLTTYEAQKILRALPVNNVVAADIVEVCPAYDSSDITSLAAVDAIFEILCLMAKHQ